MKPLSIVYHSPTGLWQVLDERGTFLVAFASEKMAEQFARYGSVSVYDFA